MRTREVPDVTGGDADVLIGLPDGSTRPVTPSAAEFLAEHRGGGAFTRLVNQRLGSYLCVLAHRCGVGPTALTLANLVLGLAAAALVAGSAGAVHAGELSGAAVALGAVVLWQLAYSLDCADGQLARRTGRANAAGARVDILCDAAIHAALVSAVAVVAAEFTPDLPGWLPPAFAGIWVANLLAPAGLQPGRAGGSLFADSTGPLLRLLGLAVDYGAVVTALGVVLAFAPARLAQCMVAFVVVHGGLLLVRIGVAARASVQHRAG